MTPFFPFPNNRTLFGIPISVIAVIILSAMDTDEQAKANNLFFSFLGLHTEMNHIQA